MKIPLGYAIKDSFANGLTISSLLRDFQAGLSVGVIAIPLGMALAIASGVTPQNGLYTIITAGFIVALLGGSRFLVNGPTAAFVVLLVPIVHKFGLNGLLTAGFLSGILLFLLGVSKLGRFIRLVPHPVTTGFTSGIAVVIFVIQLKDFFGLTLTKSPESFFDRIHFLIQAAPTIRFSELGIGLFTLCTLLLSLRFLKKLPAPVVAITLSSVLVYFLKKYFPHISIETIHDRFTYTLHDQIQHGIPVGLPRFDWPWNWSSSNSDFRLNYETIQALLPSSCAIALLGAIESLLSALVADGMTQTQHDPDSELTALGIGSMICPFFGGIAPTGAIARTSVNIRFGATSPLASCFHALTVLLALIFLSPLLGTMPMAGLAGLLLYVAYNMFEKHHFMNILKTAPRSDRLVLLTCFLFTIIFDMVIGVGVGVGLACVLIVRRIAEVTHFQTHSSTTGPQELKDIKLPSHIYYCQVSGPLFFGVSHRAIESICNINQGIKLLILDLQQVPFVDASGLVALDSSLKRYIKAKRKVAILCHKGRVLELIRPILKQYRTSVVLCEDLKDAMHVK